MTNLNLKTKKHIFAFINFYELDHFDFVAMVTSDNHQTAHSIEKAYRF
jgi:hypothetical protein